MRSQASYARRKPQWRYPGTISDVSASTGVLPLMCYTHNLNLASCYDVLYAPKLKTRCVGTKYRTVLQRIHVIPAISRVKLAMKLSCYV